MILPEINERRARRAIDRRPVPADVVERMVSAATMAASCSNRQPWRLVAIQSDDALARVREQLSGGNYWARTAPLIVVAATRRDLDCALSDNRDYALFDTGMAVCSLLLQATREGLYAHPIAGFDPIGVKEAIGIPEGFTVIALVIVGYPGDETHLSEKHSKAEHDARARKPREAVVCRDSWGFAEER